MKKLTLAAMIFLAALNIAYGETNPINTLTLEAAQKQAYWYSLYNVAHLTMFSGMGEVMKGGGMIGIIDWLKGGGVQRAEPVKNMYMISSVYAKGDPHFTQPVNPDNKRSMGWDREKMDRTLDPSAHAFTIIKSLAKNFHRDYHETKDNQRVAIAMYPEAKEMAKLLAERMTDEQGQFVSISPEGKKGRPLAFDQVSVLWAFSDLALISNDPEVPPYNDYELTKWSRKMADKTFEVTKALPSKTIIEKSLAIEAYGRYANTTEDSKLRGEALKSIKNFAREISKTNPRTITEMGLSVYGLMEAYRVSGVHDFLEKALGVFNADMEGLWDEKAGVYATSKDARSYVYTPFDVGGVLAALNSMIWFALPSYEDLTSSGPDLAKKRYIRFFENVMVISGMQQASGISIVDPIYLKREPEIHFAHPALLLPEKAGGRFGKAPVYAGEVTYQNEQWKVTNQRFGTRDAMFLAHMSVMLNRHQIDSFIPLEKLTSKLLADMGL